jgi:hypothetical protein
MTPDPNLDTIFVAELTPDGAAVWSRAIHFFPTSPGDNSGWLYVDMAVSPTGDMFIGGGTHLPVDYGAGMVPVSTDSTFFARYDPAGNVIHGGVLPAYPNPVPSVAVDAAGNALLALELAGTFDLGAGAMGTSGDVQLYLARLDPKGHLLSATALTEPIGGVLTSDLWFGGVAVDVTGNTWLCATVSGSPITVAGTTVQPVAKEDILLLELDPAGNLVHERQFGTTGSSECWGIRLGPTGVPAIFGTMNGSVDFGQGLLQAMGTTDGFIAKLGP